MHSCSPFLAWPGFYLWSMFPFIVGVWLSNHLKGSGFNINSKFSFHSLLTLMQSIMLTLGTLYHSTNEWEVKMKPLVRSSSTIMRSYYLWLTWLVTTYTYFLRGYIIYYHWVCFVEFSSNKQFILLLLCLSFLYNKK